MERMMVQVGLRLVSAIMTLKNRQVVEDVIHFRKIVLSPDWNNNVLNQYYLNNTATRNLFPAEFAAQAVAHMVLHGNYAGIESYSEHIGEERFDGFGCISSLSTYCREYLYST